MAKSTEPNSTNSARERHGAPVGVLEQAAGVFDQTVKLRRNLHRWPELGNDLPKTREQVMEQIQHLPLDITLHSTTSGIAAMLTGDKPGPTVLLRGDMDALPMPEDTDIDFKSNVDGMMHACGHDQHTAMLVGAAKVLSARKSEIAGRVLFMFQPGEEGFGGANYMLDEGILDVPHLTDGSESPVTGAFALHVSTNIPNGMLAIKGGPTMASSDTLSITITGRGGHASSPHFALDPVPVACEIVQALQIMVTRRLDVFDPGVVTVTTISAGTASNVIPESVVIKGTIRAVSEGTRNKIHDNIRRLAETIAAAHEMTADVELGWGYPVTVNDADFADFAFDVATALVGDKAVIKMPAPVMGAEDFSYVLNKVPGSMMFLGASPDGIDPRTAPPNHSNRAVFNEATMKNGIAMYTSMALRHLDVPLS